MVIVLVLALFLPAVNSVRGLSRANVCRNNIRNIALALTQYENINREYPALNNVVSIDGQDVNRPLMFYLLPYLERSDLHIRYVESPTDIADQGDGSHYLNILVCPSDFEASRMPTSFVFNTGLPNTRAFAGELVEGPDCNAQNNGVFFADRRNGTTNSDYVMGNDGMSTTLLVSENISAGAWNDGSENRNGFVWHDVPPEQQSRVSINAQVGEFLDGMFPSGIVRDIAWARPSSNHHAGVNVAFADAHVAFLNDTIDYSTYAQLMTSAGRLAGLNGGMMRPQHVTAYVWPEDEVY